MDPLLGWLHEHRADMVAALAALVDAESPSDSPGHVETAGDLLARAAADLGARVDRLPCGSAARAVRARFDGADAGAAPVVLIGHLDTVWPLGTVKARPFTLDGQVARGPGVFDMKAGLVQGLFALAALRALGRTPPRPVVLLATGDEERGSRQSRPVVEAEARGAAAALILEPAAGERGALKTGRKGVGLYSLRVTGRAAHAGLEPEKGVSALEEMARVILACHALTDLGRGTTVNVGVATGGTRPNVIAAEATAELDVRVSSRAEADRVDAAIRALRPAHPDARIEVEGGLNRPPMERTEAAARLLALARQAAAAIGLPEPGEASVGGGSDGNFTSALGVPTLDGLGAIGDGAHALHEHVRVDRMPERAALLARLIEMI
ncbi:MAG TPA: M20 family metallopeptidase [Thermodesulfobacteriota bacterium]